MERLSGIDASFLYLDTPAHHMHTLKVAVLEHTCAPDQLRARLGARLRARRGQLGIFERRILPVPFGLHHPLWIEAEHLDVRHHLRGLRLPAPGGARELDLALGELASTPLDRQRPLWELWILSGLADDRVALVAKIHHALADGVAAAALISLVLGPLLDESDRPWLEDPRELGRASPELPLHQGLAAPRRRAPGAARLMIDALRERRQLLRELPPLLSDTLRRLLAASRHRREGPGSWPLPLGDAPATPWSGAVTAERVVSRLALDLRRLNAIKQLTGVTLNDVFLTLVAGALRRRLIALEALPSRPLVAVVPVATEREPRRMAGNRLSSLFTSLCTDIADPAERLGAIHRAMCRSKAGHQLLGHALYAQWLAHALPGPLALAVRLHARTGLADRQAPPVNVIVSNVPGPIARLEGPGGRLRELYSGGPIVEGVPLNVTAWSYADRFFLGILTCPRLIPDPATIAAGIEAELDELESACARAPASDHGLDRGERDPS